MSETSLAFPSPVGELLLTASDRALKAVHFPNSPMGPLSVTWSSPAVPLSAGRRGGTEEEILERTGAQLAEYFAGTRTTFDLPLDPPGTAFERRVWDALRAIPYGTTVSYGELARRLGDGRATRAVGAANGKNPIPIIVPCHRVVGSRGELTGFGGGLERKRWLLEHEGVLMRLGR
jgi:methylated-DNA-[protein]-cysteine S-methyltransferase